MTVARIVALFFLCVAASVAVGDDDELKRLQGQFERTVTNEAGVTFRVVKELVGDRSTVTTYDDEGRVVTAHTSTCKLEKRGEVRVFSYFDLKVTAGPAKGREEPAVHSYLYRYDGETFAEAWGLLAGDPSPPRLILWRKVR